MRIESQNPQYHWITGCHEKTSNSLYGKTSSPRNNLNHPHSVRLGYKSENPRFELYSTTEKKKIDRAGACKARGQESASTIMKKRGRENRDENEKARHTSIIHARIELDNYGAALDGLEKIVGRFRRPRGLRWRSIATHLPNRNHQARRDETRRDVTTGAAWRGRATQQTSMDKQQQRVFTTRRQRAFPTSTRRSFVHFVFVHGYRGFWPQWP